MTDDDLVAAMVKGAHKRVGVKRRPTGQSVAARRQQGSTVYVYRSRTYIWGTVTATFMDGGRAMVDDLAVRTHHWGKGVGREIVTALLAELRDQGVDTVVAVTLPGMDAAAHLLESLGSTAAPDPAESGKLWHVVPLS